MPFDNTLNEQVQIEVRAPDYGGFNWGANTDTTTALNVYLHFPNDPTGPAPLPLLWEPHSGDVLAKPDDNNTSAKPIVITQSDGDDFSFVGAWFSSAFNPNLLDPSVDILVTAKAFDGITQVGTATFLVDTGGPFLFDFADLSNLSEFQTFTGTFANIDRLELSSLNAFSLDNFTFIANPHLVADEDNLPLIGNNDVAAGDEPQQHLTGTLGFNPGADGATVSFADLHGDPVKDTSNADVTIGTPPQTLTYFWNAATNTLYATTAANAGDAAAIANAAFSIQLTPATGDYTFTLLKAINHASGGAENNVFIDLSYVVTDGDGDTVTGTLEVSIDNDLPVAVNDATTTAEDTPVTYNVITNGDGTSDAKGADGATLTAAVIQNPAHGTVTAFAANGNITFAPAPGFAGAAVINYTITDGDGDASLATLTVLVPPDSVPQVVATQNVVVDEDGFVLTAAVDTLTPRSDETDSTESLTGSGTATVDFNNDVPVSLAGSIVLVDTLALDNQLQTLDGLNVTFALDISGDLVGTVSGGTREVIRIEITGAALGVPSDQVVYTYQVTLSEPVKHDAGGVENSELLSGVTFQVTDKDGDTLNGSFNVTIVDNVPSVVTAGTAPTLTVDETVLTADDTESFAANFTSSFGADGSGSITYALNAVAGASGLVDTATGQAVNLSLTGGGVVEGHTALSNALVFTVSVDGSGNVTLDQLRAVVHTPNTGPDQTTTPSAANLVTLTATITDADGDSNSAVLNIGQNLSFKDNGPSANSLTLATNAVVHDETPGLQVAGDPNASNDVAGGNAFSGPSGPTTIATIFSGVATPGDDPDVSGSGPIGYAVGAGITGASYAGGADGVASTLYSLELFGGAPVLDSGLDTTAGLNILLVKEGDLIVGRVDGDSNGAVSSLTDPAAFAIAIGQDGTIGIVQYLSIKHPTTGASYDETVTIDPSKVIARFTVTDGDGDQSSLTADISTRIGFGDNGPDVDIAGSTSVDETQSISGTWTLAEGADGVTQATVSVPSISATGILSIPNGVLQPSGSPTDTETFTVLGGTLTVNNDGTWTYTAASVSSDQSFSFSIAVTDGDQDTDSNSQSIQVVNVNQPLAITGSVVDKVEEEHGLPGGIDDTSSASIAPNHDADVGAVLTNTTNVSVGTFSSFLTFTGNEGALTYSFAPVATGTAVTKTDTNPLMSEGAAVLFHLDTGTNTLIGYVNGVTPGYTLADDREVFTLEINQPATGQYRFTLLDNLDHHPIASPDNVENIIGINFNGLVIVNDGGDVGDTEPIANFAINIIDDIPAVETNTRSVVEGTIQTVDVQFIVDRSGSMFPSEGSLGFVVPGYSQDRMGLARYSIEQLLLSNEQIQNVQIVRFGTSADGTDWLTKAQALAFIQDNNNWGSGGRTNYDLALQQAIADYTTARPSPESDQTFVYFVSDGAPNDGGGITDTNITVPGDGVVTIADWENHVTSQGIDQVFAIGIGSGVSVSNLEPVAYPNTDVAAPIGDEDHVVIVNTANVNVLLDTLQDLLGSTSSITGNILLDDPSASTGADGFGADGGYIKSITINGTIYTFNGSTTSVSGADPGAQLLENNGTSIKVLTDVGGTLTFYFATTSINAAGSWGYLAPLENSGPETFAYTIVDGDGDGATSALNITVLPINEAPAGTNNAVAATEDQAFTFTAAHFGFADPNDTPANQLLAVKITTLETAGDLELNGVDVTVGQVISKADIDAGLLKFTGALNANGTPYASFTFQVQDDGGILNGGVDLDQSPNTMTVNVTAVNDAPTANITSATFSATEQTDLTLANTGISLGSIADIDAGSNVISATLSVTHGILTVTAGNSGVDSVTGSGTSSVTVTGTVTEINNLIGGVAQSSTEGTIIYNPNSDNPPATATLTLLVDDTGDTGGGALTASDIATINITAVNDAPNTNAGSGTGSEDATSIAVSLSGTDVDGTVASFKITSLPGNGTLYTDSGLGTAITLVSAPVPATGNAATVYFVPALNFNGSPTFQYAAIDNNGTQDGSAATATITVNAVNDAPTANITSATFSATEQTDLTLANTGISLGSIADIDAGSNVISATLSVTHGILTVTAGNSGVDSVTGSGTSSVTVTGTVTEINNLIGGVAQSSTEGTIIYNPNSDNPPATATLTLLVDDTGDTGGGALTASDIATINITAVNDAPNTNAGSGTGSEDATSIAVSLSGTDVDGTVASFKITSLPGNGTLYTDSGLGTAITLVSAPVPATGNAATVYFVPALNFNGSPTFQYAAIDNNGTQDGSAATATITVNAVNDAPVLTDVAVPALTAVNEDAGVPSGAVGTVITSLVDFVTGGSSLNNVTDIDASAVLGVALTGTNNANGIWYYSTNSGGAWTAVGTVSNSQALLLSADGTDRLYFKPEPNFNGTVSNAITFRAWDQSNGAGLAGTKVDTTTNGGITPYSTVTDTTNVTVNLVNDAPYILAPGTVTGTSSNFFALRGAGSSSTPTLVLNTIAFQDADSGAGSVTVILSVPSASLDGTFTAADGASLGVTEMLSSGNRILTLSGTVANINAYLAAGNASITLVDVSSHTLTVSINDGIAPAVSTTMTLDSDQLSDLVENLAGRPIDAAGGATILDFGAGNDTVTTAWTHIPAAQTITYQGGADTDTVTVAFTPAQLEAILADGSARGELLSYFDGNVAAGDAANQTLDLSATTWNAIIAQGFEDARIALATYAGGSATYTGTALDTLPAFLAGVTGNASDNTMIGTAGDDTGAGALSGGDGNDVLAGLAGNDQVNGGTGADLILGGAGNDTITGGLNADLLSGGTGADVFIYAETTADSINANADRVVDYSYVDGDKIDLSSLLGSYTPTSLISDFVRLQVSGSDIQVQVDTDGGVDNFFTVATLTNYATGAPDLVKVTFASKDFVLSEGVADPIILDLGAPGISFTPLDDGVQFDINADGTLDQVAWTAGDDGILAYDLDLSGKIENGAEIFTPQFAGGSLRRRACRSRLARLQL